MAMIRLFINQENLNINCQFKIGDSDFIYLSKVMRQKIDSQILVFNDRDGEFKASIIDQGKKYFTCQIIEKTSPYVSPNNITLAFAPVKNVRIDFIAAKATELGVKKFQPIFSQHTVIDKINYNRFNANLKEAAEQCGRMDLPAILPIKKLYKLLEEDLQRIFLLCDESGNGSKASDLLPKINFKDKEVIILIGPEGGFSKEEFEKMYRIENLYPISLGPLILRSDTAIISALTLVQEFFY